MAKTEETKVVEDNDKVIFDYNKLTAEDMRDYIVKNHNTKEDKEEFKKNAFEIKSKKVAVQVIGKDGKPVYYVDKKGKTRIRQTYVDKPSGEKNLTFNNLKAKKYFYETYKDEIIWLNAPKTKPKKDAKPTAEELFADF